MGSLLGIFIGRAIKLAIGNQLAIGVAAALAALHAATATAQMLGAERVAFGLDAPTFAAAPDGDARLFITQRAGKIVLLANGGVSATPFLDIEAKVDDEGEGGLLGLAFPPDYAQSGFFYVYYTAGDPLVTGDLVAVVARYDTTGNPATSPIADPNSEAIVFAVAKPSPEHNGGTIAIRDGFLYLGLGDGGGAGDPDDLAQDDGSPFGKILRFDLSHQPLPIPPSIWAKGFRNPFRFSFDRATGDLYVGDVGQDAVEEVSVEPASSAGGRNYGWDVKEGSGCFDEPPTPGEPDCDDASLVDPVHEYPHEGVCNSVTGGVVYRGSAIPQLVGQYLFGDFCTEQIWSFTWDGAGGTVGPVVERTNTIIPNFSGIDAISAFAEDSAGEVYVVDLGGEIFKLVPEPSAALAGAAAIAALGTLRARRPRGA